MPGLSPFPHAKPRGSIPFVIGLGNSLAGDDGVGIEFIRLLRSQKELDCDLLEWNQAGLELLDLFEGSGPIVFVDAVRSGSPPGTLHLVPLPSADIEFRHVGKLSSHGLGLQEALELCHVLNRPIPRLMLLGIEVERTEHGEGMSVDVARALQRVALSFSSLIRLLNTADSPLWRARHCCPAGNGSLIWADIEPASGPSVHTA